MDYQKKGKTDDVFFFPTIAMRFHFVVQGLHYTLGGAIDSFSTGIIRKELGMQ